MTRIFKAKIEHAIIIIKGPIIGFNEQLLKVLNQQTGIRIYFMEEQDTVRLKIINAAVGSGVVPSGADVFELDVTTDVLESMFQLRFY